MKVVVAMDSFKSCMTAMEACDAVEQGIKRADPSADIVKVPMADGGEGTVQSLVECTGGVVYKERVTGPLGDPVEAFYGVLGDGETAVIEMAAASGLPLVPDNRRNPLFTTTYGTGELIRKALDRGCSKILIGIGGSATNDGGVGMAQALGIRFLKHDGKEIGFGGGELKAIGRIDMSAADPRLDKLNITVLSDVDNPLFGPSGAAAVYGPQKGATPEMIAELDEGLRHYADIIRSTLDKDIANIAGSGAAGGLGAGLIAFLNATLKPGIDIVISASKLAQKLAGADYCITGEGRIDGQTARGKTPAGVAKAAGQFGVPVIALAGSLGDDAKVVHEHGIDAVFSIIPYPLSLKQAMEMERAKSFLSLTAEELFRVIGIKK